MARHGLAERRALTLVKAAACPVSDFQKGSALLALAARAEHVTRDEYLAAAPAVGRGGRSVDHQPTMKPVPPTSLRIRFIEEALSKPPYGVTLLSAPSTNGFWPRRTATAAA